MTWWNMRNMETCMCLMCLNMSLMRARHLFCWKRNLSFLFIMVTHFFKKCMIPCPLNQPMRKFWVSFFILLHPKIPCFVALVSMNYGWKGSSWWCHMRSMELLDLLFVMKCSYSCLKHHPLLLYDDAHLHGCTYDMNLTHLKTHGFSASTLGSFDIGGTSSNMGWTYLWL